MDYSQVLNVACAITGVDLDKVKDEDLEITIEDKLDEKFGIDIDQLEKITEALLPFTPPVTVDGQKGDFHAFLTSDNDILAIIKK